MTELEKEFYPLGAIRVNADYLYTSLFLATVTGKVLRVTKITNNIIMFESPNGKQYALPLHDTLWCWEYKPPTILIEAE